jgi:pyruvate dehydrogenase E1 component alpha subunit
LWKLPVIYVCENNMYSEYTHFSETTAGDIMARATAFGVIAETIDGQDVRTVNRAASKLIDRARSGEGPALLVCETYRYGGHHVGDINRAYYRSKQEEQVWVVERDPIKIFARQLIDEKVTDAAGLMAIDASVKTEIATAAEFALNAPYPSADQAEEDVYAAS